jgi:formylmethanofuran dehydrogenase subunit D
MNNNSEIKQGWELVCHKDYSPYLRVCFVVGDKVQIGRVRGYSVEVKSERLGKVVTFATKEGCNFPLLSDYFE